MSTMFLVINGCLLTAAGNWHVPDQSIRLLTLNINNELLERPVTLQPILVMEVFLAVETLEPVGTGLANSTFYKATLGSGSQRGSHTLEGSTLNVLLASCTLRGACHLHFEWRFTSKFSFKSGFSCYISPPNKHRNSWLQKSPGCPWDVPARVGCQGLASAGVLGRLHQRTNPCRVVGLPIRWLSARLPCLPPHMQAASCCQ
jgi:hypothetical protein